jgi:hypothetical protein
MTQVGFYGLSYNNPEKKRSLVGRFKALGLDITISEGFNRQNKALSTMLGHLSLIRKFYESENEYAVICEDGIFVHKNLKTDMPRIIEEFKSLKLDMLLMGYLIMQPSVPDFFLMKKMENFSFYYMPEPLWGAQMYLISKKYAREVLEKYSETEKYANLEENVEKERGLDPKISASDWSITKGGNRAMVHPMYGVKDGSSFYEDEGQRKIHFETFFCNLTRNYL